MPVDRWSEEETRRLAGLVERLGQRWCLVAEHLAPRTSKQCRRRWKNVVALPERKDTPWTQDEDSTLTEAYDALGAKWTDIAKRLIGRTDNAVKNRWSLLHKRRAPKRNRDGGDEGGSDARDEDGSPCASKHARTGRRPLVVKRVSSSAANKHISEHDNTSDAIYVERMPRSSQLVTLPTQEPPTQSSPCPDQSPAPPAPQHATEQQMQPDPSDQTSFMQQCLGSGQSAARDTCTSSFSHVASMAPEPLQAIYGDLTDMGDAPFDDPFLDPFDYFAMQPSGVTPSMRHFLDTHFGVE